MKRIYFFLILSVFFPWVISSDAHSSPSWKTMMPGLEELRWNTRDSKGNSVTLQLYKIEPKKFRFQVAQAKDFKLESLSAKEMVEHTGGLLAINASFFDSFYKPLGLVVQDGKLANPLRPVSWWAVFAVDKNHLPRVVRSKDFQLSAEVELAVQVGPRLVEEGRPIVTKNNVSKKSFVAVTYHHEVILGVTEEGIIDSNDLSKILAEEIKVRQALNLDGGGSTQLYARFNSYEKEVPGFTAVANGIVVLPRK